MDENTLEVAPEATETIAPVETFSTNEESMQNSQFTAEDISKARAQEKAKLYPQVEKLQEELALLRSREQEREAKEAERKAARAARDAEAAALKKQQEESELEAKDLLLRKEEEWNARFEMERSEREKAFALLDQERRFQELSAYRQQRIADERENIVPELIDLISGNTADEIEASVADLKVRSSKIFESVAAASQQTRKEMVGARVTMPASGPLDNDSAQSALTPERIASMSQAEYAKHRASLLGTAGNNRGQGLFG
jgi:hypothetical protein